MCRNPVGEGAKRVTTADRGSVIEEGELNGRGAAALSTRSERPPSWRRWLSSLRMEAATQVDRWLLAAPVAAGGGAATYLGLPTEPSLGAVILASALLAAFALI